MRLKRISFTKKYQEKYFSCMGINLFIPSQLMICAKDKELCLHIDSNAILKELF
jgi:hypothetical protein